MTYMKCGYHSPAEYWLAGDVQREGPWQGPQEEGALRLGCGAGQVMPAMVQNGDGRAA